MATHVRPDLSRLAERAERHLHALCVDIADRRVGGGGNRRATDYVAGVAASCGFEVATPRFDCLDWRGGAASLTVAGGETFAAAPAPYAPGCDVRGPLAVCASDAELERTELDGSVALLRGELAREQLMPKNFPFFNPDRHRRIVALLEAKAPRAIVAATARDASTMGGTMGGGLDPFPLIEDGDVDIPSVMIRATEGERLARHAGRTVVVRSDAERIASWGCNVVARAGGEPEGRRVVLFAHVDAKPGTPGALDNASGTVTLLLLAELLRGYAGEPAVELTFLNGEDHYAAPGERLWLERNEHRTDDIVLGINLDGVGDPEGRSAWSLYGCSLPLEELLRAELRERPELVEGDAWYTGDHSLFVMQGVPALAFTSERIWELLASVIHTPDDTPGRVDPQRLAGLAAVLLELLRELRG